MAPTTRSLAALAPDTYVKALKADRTHHGFTYVLGRNDCPQPFSEGLFSGGGLYYCCLKDLLHWVALYPDIDTVAVVEVPEDAKVVSFEHKFKASSIVLTQFIPLVKALELAIQHGADIHGFDNRPLRMASMNGHLPVVQYLVEHGADAKNNEALFWASRNGHLPIVQFLVQHGATDPSRLALYTASNKGHVDVVQFLQSLP